MVNFDFYNDCCGCGGCYNICPVKAINMSENEEGFKIPVIDTNKCINCGQCEKVCPHLSNNKVNNIDNIAWLYASKNAQAKKKSSSGAAFYEIAKAGIKNGYYVSGCVWDDKLTAIHIVGNNMDVVHSMQGSKYVQSDTKTIYKDIIDLLKQGQKVIFSGVPCQCTAMGNYVNNIANGKYRESLLTVALICHGVASPLVWESFKKWTSEKKNSNLIGVNFRDKTKEGYKKSYCRYDYADGHATYLPTFLPSSKYIEATLVYNLAIRNSCSHCDCKGHNENIDIILGDWYKEYKGDGILGTSCIVAYTKRGESYLLENITNLKEIEYSEIYKENRFIEESEHLGANRAKFFSVIKDYRSWNKIERLYPAKYPLKKFLIKTGLYDIINGKV